MFIVKWLGVAVIAVIMGQAAVAAERTITVMGTGAVNVVPDMAEMNLGVVQVAPDAAEAVDAMSAAMQAVIGRVASAGIDAADVQTGGLQLNPRYESGSLNGRAQINGYEASSTISVKVRDLALLGDVVGAAVGEGANQFHGLSFDVAARDALTDEARKVAVADAVAKAELYAQAAGVALGDVITIAEPGQGGGGGPVMMEAMAMRSVPVAAGEISISADVVMVFAIDG